MHQTHQVIFLLLFLALWCYRNVKNLAGLVNVSLICQLMIFRDLLFTIPFFPCFHKELMAEWIFINMSTITHALFGGAVGLLFYFITRNSRKVFNERMVIIFTFNSFIGPDLFKIPRLFLTGILMQITCLDSLVLWLH